MTLPSSAPTLGGRPVFRQRWDQAAFVHWALDAEIVAPFLPPGVRPDVHSGSSYVGLVAFSMARVAVGSAPYVPWLGTFLETNVRLYSVDDLGRHGVVFLSLDASRLLTVAAVRAGYRLPYLWARMSMHVDGEVVTYAMRRRWPGPRGARSAMSVRVGERVASPTALETFVTARFGLHSTVAAHAVWTPNVHSAWPLHRAELLHLDDQLIAAAGLPAPAGDPVSVLFSPGVDTVFGRPRLLHRARVAARRPAVKPVAG